MQRRELGGELLSKRGRATSEVDALSRLSAHRTNEVALGRRPIRRAEQARVARIAKLQVEQRCLGIETREADEVGARSDDLRRKLTEIDLAHQLLGSPGSIDPCVYRSASLFVTHVGKCSQ